MTGQISSCYRLMITLAFFLCADASLPASAGESGKPDGPSATVNFEDLDLNTDAGSRELLKRLSEAAYRVCWQYWTARSDDLRFYEVHPCTDRTLAVAVEKVHHAHVSALFAATSHHDTR